MTDQYPRGDITVVRALLPTDKKGMRLIKRNSDAAMYPSMYELPGGQVKEDEALDVALARETWEEIHLTATFELEAFVKIDEYIMTGGKNEGGLYIAYVALGHYIRQKERQRVGNEHTNILTLPYGSRPLLLDATPQTHTALNLYYENSPLLTAA